MRRRLCLVAILAWVGLGCPGETAGPVDGGNPDEEILPAFPDMTVGNDDAGGADDAGGPSEASLPGVAPHHVVIHPEVDAHVRSGSLAATTYGTAAALWVDQDVSATVSEAYVRFRVGAVGTVARALLHLYVSDGSTGTFDLVMITDAGFTESINWSTKPTVDGAALGTLTAPAAARWVELDVTAHVKAESTFSFAILPKSTDGIGIASREATSHRPKLVLELGADVPPNAIQPEVDTFVRSGSFADQTFGKLPYLDVDGEVEGTVKQAFIRFQIGAVPAIERAVLRLYLLDGSASSATVVSIPDHSFGDSVSWNTKPSVSGTSLAAISAVARGWVELDVTGAVAPSSALSLALLPASDDGIRIASSESSFHRPLLVLTTRKASCGDGRCDTGETCGGCAADCGGACPAGCLAGELFAARGDHHAHTSYSDGEGTPADAFKAARSKLDYLILTDHIAAVSTTEWSSCQAAAKGADTPGTFLAACAYETWIGPGLGHANVLFPSSLTAVPNSSTYAAWYAKLGACSGCLGQMNHPVSESFPWTSVAYSANAAGNMALCELNGSGTFADKLAKLSAALDAGWRLSPTWNSDTHKANWGSPAVRSGFWVTALDQVSLADAMRRRRGFASNDRDAALRVRSDGCWPGSSRAASSIELVEMLATDTSDGFDRIVLVGPGNKVLKVFPCYGQRVCGGTAAVQVTGATHPFAYAVQTDGGAVVAAPVWMTP
jgi:hypothetical protein